MVQASGTRYAKAVIDIQYSIIGKNNGKIALMNQLTEINSQY